MRAQWTEELCASNGTGNTTLWQHLDDVEEAVLRYKVGSAGLQDVCLCLYLCQSCVSACVSRGSCLCVFL